MTSPLGARFLCFRKTKFKICKITYITYHYMHSFWAVAVFGFVTFEGSAGINELWYICLMFGSYKSRGSTVDKATGYGLDDRRVWVLTPVESRTFISPYRPDRFQSSSSLSYLIRTGGSFPVVKWPCVKLTTHLQLVPNSDAWIYTSAPLISLHGIVFI
jgi:hypothetical protein